MLPHLLLGNDLLIEVRRRALGEAVIPLLLPALIGLHEIAQHLRGLIVLDNAHIDIAAGPQVVEDTGLDRLRGQINRPLAVQVRLPHGLEHRHGSQRSRPHRHIGELIRRPVRVHGEQSNARRIHPGNHQIRADVALVSEEVLLEHGHAGDDARVAARRERVQFDVGADQRGGELGVGRGAGASAPDLRGDVV
jgi:hypothetical protein